MDLTFGDLNFSPFYASNCFITVVPSNLNIILFIGMGAYSNPSKFQKDSFYNSWDMTI